jgi:hypothetical protein
MRLRGFPSAWRAMAEELVPSSRVRETALVRLRYISVSRTTTPYPERRSVLARWRKRPPAFVPQGEGAYSAPCETSVRAFFKGLQRRRPAPSVPYLRKILESCEKRAGRKGIRATSVSLSVVMSREGLFYAAALVRLE